MRGGFNTHHLCQSLFTVEREALYMSTVFLHRPLFLVKQRVWEYCTRWWTSCLGTEVGEESKPWAHSRPEHCSLYVKCPQHYRMRANPELTHLPSALASFVPFPYLPFFFLPLSGPSSSPHSLRFLDIPL